LAPNIKGILREPLAMDQDRVTRESSESGGIADGAEGTGRKERRLAYAGDEALYGSAVWIDVSTKREVW